MCKLNENVDVDWLLHFLDDTNIDGKHKRDLKKSNASKLWDQSKPPSSFSHVHYNDTFLRLCRARGENCVNTKETS